MIWYFGPGYECWFPSAGVTLLMASIATVDDTAAKVEVPVLSTT